MNRTMHEFYLSSMGGGKSDPSPEKVSVLKLVKIHLCKIFRARKT